MVDLETIKLLRNKTGVSVTECQKALEEGGNIEKASEILRARGADVSQKKTGRTLGAGVVQSYIHATKDMGSMVELLCETDFVAKNEDFTALAYDIAMHIAAFKPIYRSREDIPKEEVQKYITQVEEHIPADSSEDVKTKIREGKLNSILKNFVLLEQSFIKDDTRTIQNLLDEAVQKFGERTEIGEYTILSVK